MSTSKTTKKNPILIDVPMPIETPRLIIRNAVPGDGNALYEAKKESFDELKRWMSWAQELGTVEDQEIVERKSYAEFILRTDIKLAAFEKDSGTFIGGSGLHRIDWDLRYFEIGYWIRTSASGQGYATEITNALLHYAFKALDATKVAICHAGSNEASKAVIEKLGFIKEGVFKDTAILPDGSIDDHHWYARHDLNGLPELEVTWGNNEKRHSY